MLRGTQLAIIVVAAILSGCSPASSESTAPVATAPMLPPPPPPTSPIPGSGLAPTAQASEFAKKRASFQTKLVRLDKENEAVETPPPGVFRVAQYPTLIGALPAYVSPDPQDGRKHPAIIWITGGLSNSIGEMWEPNDLDNDQSAAAYREAGIILMVPSLRGGNQNPGHKEGFFGEVDDVIAAANYLAAQPYVDPQRVYLGGHSTGGTLALLVSEATDRFRCVFAFGPVPNILNYGDMAKVFDPNAGSEKLEVMLRSPIAWLDCIRSPTFVIEGAEKPGNIDSVKLLESTNKNPNCKFLLVRNTNHFSVLGPANQRIAKKILADTGATPQITLSADELALGGQ